MKKLRWQLLVVVLALVAIAILLYSQQQPNLPGMIAAPVDEPVTGGVYTEGLVGSLSRLNPVLDSYNAADRDLDRLIYSSLVRFDDHGLPQGDLAETWGISQDGTVYNFSLRPNAVWQDGTPVSTQDISYTVSLLREDVIPTPPDIREFWKQVEVKPLDEKTLQFRLPEAFAPFMDYLTFGVLPKHLLEEQSPEEIVDSQFNLKPVGSGPYRLDHLIVEDGKIQGAALAAFDKFYGKKPFIPQLSFMFYPTAADALEGYKQGKVMGVSDVTPDVLPAALKEPNLKLYTGRLPRLSLVYLNLGQADLPFFQDPAVRRALLMGINRQWILDHILGSQAILADGPIFPVSWAYYDGIQRVEFDPEAAIALLKKAGYTVAPSGENVRSKEGVKLAFEMVYPDAAPFKEIAETIQKNWQKLGVKVDLKAVPYDQLVSDYLEPRSYQAALVDLNMARSPDPDPYPFWHQAQISGGQNYAQWDDRQASEYLEQARVTVDITERAKRYRNFQVRFTNELPALPLFYPVYTYGVDSQVDGISMGPLYDISDRLNTITSWFMAKKRASQPLVTQPSASQPANTQPSAAQPTVAQPAATQLPASEPTAAQPAATLESTSSTPAP